MNSINETTGTKMRHKNVIHSGERKHICPECQKSFTQGNSLKSHLISHSGHKPFVCQTCSKQYKRRTDLNRHMLVHSGTKPYECPTCQKCFTRKLHFKAHLNTHSKVRTHIIFCNFCHKGFLHRDSLVKHLRLHNGMKPYACDQCKKEFAQKITLIKHLSVHSGEKPFSCETCKRAFAHRHNLKKHLKIHPSKQQGEHSVTETSTSKQKELYFSKGYLDKIVTPVIDVHLQPNKPDSYFEVPIIKQELLTDEDLETPSCSYQNLDVKQEPTENADSSCLNLCDSSVIKEERESPSTIL